MSFNIRKITVAAYPTPARRPTTSTAIRKDGQDRKLKFAKYHSPSLFTNCAVALASSVLPSLPSN
jgi:hypothetical protein